MNSTTVTGELERYVDPQDPRVTGIQPTEMRPPVEIQSVHKITNIRSIITVSVVGAANSLSVATAAMISIKLEQMQLKTSLPSTRNRVNATASKTKNPGQIANEDADDCKVQKGDGVIGSVLNSFNG